MGATDLPNTTIPQADFPKITIPSGLLPEDGRFGSGPSKVRPEAVTALAGAAPGYLGTSHRRPAVRSVVGRIRVGFADLLSLPDGYEVLLGNGGATAFWDAAAFGLVERRSQHLSFGEFSAKFAAVTAAAPHLDDPEVIVSDPGTCPDPVGRPGIDAYCLTQNETSTGVVAPLRRPAGAEPGALVLVDATSGAGGVRVEAAEFDVYYCSPQKCFAADGGLWLAACSPAALERIERLGATGPGATGPGGTGPGGTAPAVTARWCPPSLSLPGALANSRLDQTYNTPALATLFLLADQIDWILGQGGLEWAAKRCEESSGILYGWAEAHPLAAPFVTEPARRSPVTVTVDLDGAVDAEVVSEVLRANGVLDTESYRKLGRNQLRLACFPAVEPADVARLVAALDWVIGAVSSKASSGG